MYDFEGDVVSPKKAYTLMIDPELLEALSTIKTRDGITVGEQIRRGIQLWLKSKGHAPPRAERKRAATRKRS
jgi:hypothetical protein